LLVEKTMAKIRRVHFIGGKVFSMPNRENGRWCNRSELALCPRCRRPPLENAARRMSGRFSETAPQR
jgi:hypothetical protein